MATKTKKTSKVENKASTKKEAKKKELVKQVTPINEALLVEEVISSREVKYIYPEDITDTLQRKAFRQKIRNTIRNYREKLFKLQGQEDTKQYKRLKKELGLYLKDKVKSGADI